MNSRNMKRRERFFRNAEGVGLWALLLLFWVGWAEGNLSAQSFSPAPEFAGRKMANFEQAFGLNAQGWSVAQSACSASANILGPGEGATFTFFIKPETPYRGAVKLEVNRYGTRMRPEAPDQPVIFLIEKQGTTQIEAQIPAEGAYVTFTPEIGELFGGYLLVLELEGRGRAFGASVVRVLKADFGTVFEPGFAVDLDSSLELSQVVFNAFWKLGIKGARLETGYNLFREDYAQWAFENDVSLLLNVGGGSLPASALPLGRERPWLSPENTLLAEGPRDNSWMSSFDETWGQYWRELLCRYGWPLGTIQALELEVDGPVAGENFAGWRSDIPRFQEAYRAMSRAVIEARESAGVKTLVGASGRSALVGESLLLEGGTGFLSDLDFINTEDFSPAPELAQNPLLSGRKSPRGPVRFWNSGGARLRSEEEIAALWAVRRAGGFVRTGAGLHASSLLTPEKSPETPLAASSDVEKTAGGVAQVWAPAAAVAAAQKWIGGRSFREILFKNGLPWVFVFEGSQVYRDGVPTGKIHPGDGTVVVVGDLKESLPPDRTPFRSVKINPGASFSIENPRDEFRVYDFYGNPLQSVASRITLPLNGSGYFLRTTGRSGSFKRLLKAIKEAQIRNVDPVEIIVYDFTAPVLRPKTTLKIRVSNVLNQTVKGSLQALVPGIVFEKETFELKLRPHESRVVEMRIVPHLSQERDGNNYPLIIAWSSPEGNIQHAETLHVQWLARHTPELDGNPEDWKEILPVSTFTPLAPLDPAAPYEPFKDWPLATERDTVSGWVAWDDAYFYFAARTPGFRPMPRFSTRDEESYFYPQTVKDGSAELSWPAGVRRFSYRMAPDLPSGNGNYNVQIAFNVLPPEKKGLRAYAPEAVPLAGAYPDSDYEFALNLCRDGGTEIFCLSRPEAPRKHFYPRQPVSPRDGGPLADDARLVIRGGFCECAIPWSRIPEVRDRVLKGKPIKFSYRVNAGERAWELPQGRSASRENPFTFHDAGSIHWANELLFGIEPAPKK